MTDLGDLGQGHSEAFAINDAGQVVGYGCWDLCDNGQGHDDMLHAFLWAHGEMTDLGTLGGSYSRANDINAGGEVVGHAFRTGEDNISEIEMSGRPVLWQPEPDNTAPTVNAGADREVEVGQPVSVTFTLADATANGPRPGTCHGVTPRPSGPPRRPPIRSRRATPTIRPAHTGSS